MGFDCGFDIFPRLNADTDRDIYEAFVTKIIEIYKDRHDENSHREDRKVLEIPLDASCGDTQSVRFTIGEGPHMPFDPNDCGCFLRFSSKVSGHLTAPAERYIQEVYQIAKSFFGSRVHFWHEMNETGDERQNGYYSWTEIHNANRNSEEQPTTSSILPINTLKENRELYFPTFGALPSEHDLDLGYYETTNGYSYKPRQHWCFLGEILSIDDLMRIRLWVRDKEGVEVPVSFYTDGRGYDLPAESIKKGDTIAVLYAEQHPFLDLSVGLRVEVICSVKIFEKPLNDILGLLARADDRGACAHCSKAAENLPRCGRCDAVQYCDKNCQTIGWKSKHKNECKLLRSADFKVLLNVSRPFSDELLTFMPQRPLR